VTSSPPGPDEAERAHVAELVRVGHRGYLFRAAGSLTICALLSVGLLAGGTLLRRWAPDILGPPAPMSSVGQGTPVTPGTTVPGTALSPTTVTTPTGTVTPTATATAGPTLTASPTTAPPVTESPSPTPVVEAPARPANLTARVENVETVPYIALRWTQPTGGPVSRYEILRNSAPEPTPHARLDAPATGYLDRAYDGMAHTYHVRAVGPGGNALSDPATVPAAPAAPLRLSATVDRTGKVVLGWVQPNEGGSVDTYALRRDSAEIDRIAAPAVRYTDRGYDGAGHTYDIRAIGPGGAARSTPVSVRPIPGPAGHVAVRLDPDCAALVTWSEPASGGPRDGYAVLRDGVEVARLDAGARSYADHAYDGGTHVYQVRTLGPGGTAASPPATLPGALVNLCLQLGRTGPYLIARLLGPTLLSLELALARLGDAAAA
jgi:hypothetical protein